MSGQAKGAAKAAAYNTRRCVASHALRQGPDEVVFYASGFTLNGGPFRPLSDPLNTFIRRVGQRGLSEGAGASMMQAFGGGMLEVPSGMKLARLNP